MMTQIKLTNVPDEYMAQNVIDLFRSEGIDSYYVPNSYGELTQVIAGHSAFGYDIFVRESDRQRAEEVLKYFEFD
jgi:hypothetical protein